MEKCRLCRKTKKLEQSHIVPKFVINWLKQTGSGFLRRVVTPNIRYQDLSKIPLLCKECEQKFARKESYFCTNIFHPCINEKDKSLPYNESLHYFLISVLWRILTTSLSDYKKERKKFIDILENTEKDWREYLLGNRNNVKTDVHLFLTDILEGITIPVRKFNLYLTRSIDGTIAYSHTDCLVYTKFARFCIFSPLTDYDTSLWVNTKIVNGKEVLKIPQQIRDGRIGAFLISRAREAMTIYNKNLSLRQEQKILNHQKKILPKIIKSDFGVALFKDSFSDIDKSLFPKKIGRNEVCPCGSGLKYKKCCGK